MASIRKFLTDEQWAKIASLLPSGKPGFKGGRPPAQDLWLKIWHTFLSQLDAEGALDWEEAFIDASFTPAKKGAPGSGKPSAARDRSG